MLNNNQEASLKRNVNNAKVKIETYANLVIEKETTCKGDVITVEVIKDWGMNDKRISLLKKKLSFNPIVEVDEEPNVSDCSIFDGYETVPDFLKFIDENKISTKKIKECLDLNADDLKNMRKYLKVKKPTVSEAINPKLPQNSTDIFFIGTPSSGKTCVIASTLDLISKSGRLIIDPSQIENREGFQYVDYLRSCMELRVMPVSTKSDMSVYMTLNLLVDPSDFNSGEYQWNIIEMAGERLKDTYNGVGDGINPNGWFKSSKNRKVINFVIDCDYNENEMLQDSILNTAYAQLKQWGVFKMTDVVNILITKFDIEKTEDSALVALNKVQKDFTGLYNSLKREQNKKGFLGIGNGENFALNIIPISIGKEFRLNGAFMKNHDQILIKDFVDKLLAYTYYWR